MSSHNESIATPGFVLVGTQLPENLGAACRTMRCFGMTRLALVAPQCDPEAEGCVALAAGAHDIALGAALHETLAEAVKEARVVVGLTRRSGRIRRLDGTLAEVFAALGHSEDLCMSEVSFVFGPEATGLSAEDIGRCDLLAEIPTGPGTQGSLNLAHAVTCVCYELTRNNQVPAHRSPARDANTLPLAEARSASREALLEYLDRIDFYTSEPRHIVDQRLAQMLRRSLLTSHDLVLLTKLVQKLIHRKAPTP